MDRMIYVAASGIRATMQRQEVLANNLANVNTAGFRAENVAFRVAPVQGQGLPTRAMVAESTPGADFTPGVITTTGRSLDVAVQGSGFFAVQGRDGIEGYTRNGGFVVDDQGILTTHGGQPVMGDGGPISVQPGTAVTIAVDGSISGAVPGSKTVTPIGRLKLVNPATADLQRGTDGLFRMKDGSEAQADPRVRVAPGAIESSNVNAVEVMVGMITLARQFEMQMKLLQSADAADRKGATLLGAGG